MKRSGAEPLRLTIYEYWTYRNPQCDTEFSRARARRISQRTRTKVAHASGGGMALLRRRERRSGDATVEWRARPCGVFIPANSTVRATVSGHHARLSTGELARADDRWSARDPRRGGRGARGG